MKKISFMLVLLIVLSIGTNIIASAEEYGVNPRLNNANNIQCSFYIQDDVAIADVNVSGYNGVTSRISVNVLLEKKGLFGLWWTDVKEWNETSTSSSKYFSFAENVGNGTYRCTFEVTVEGSNGSADVYSKTITVEN